MRIGLLADRWVGIDPTEGQGIYAYYLSREIRRITGQVTLVCKTIPQQGPYLKEGMDIFAYAPHWFPEDGRRMRWVRDKLINRAIEEFDVFHDPTNYDMALGETTCKKIITIHDAGPLDYTGYWRDWHIYGYQALLPAILRNVAAVITDSNFQRERILHWFDVNATRVFPIPLGVDRTVFRKIAGERESADRYFLYVGSLHPRKGARLLLQSLVHLAFPPYRLYMVCGGKPYEMRSLIAEIERLGLSQRVQILGRVSSQALAQLYSFADALVSPSLYEGYNLPVLEAMACGCPTVISRIPIHEELYAGATLFFEPRDMRSLAQSLLRIAQSRALAEDLACKGLDLTRQYTWERTALETLGVYEETLRRGNRHHGKTSPSQQQQSRSTYVFYCHPYADGVDFHDHIRSDLKDREDVRLLQFSEDDETILSKMAGVLTTNRWFFGRLRKLPRGTVIVQDSSYYLAFFIANLMARLWHKQFRFILVAKEMPDPTSLSLFQRFWRKRAFAIYLLSGDRFVPASERVEKSLLKQGISPSKIGHRKVESGELYADICQIAPREKLQNLENTSTNKDL